jgi:DNA-binding IclR family transcriptional regulator
MPRRTSHTMTAPSDMLAHLTEVRRRGYAIDDEEDEVGLRCIGAAVTGNDGQVVGAVSISTLVHELPLRETRAVGAEVLTTAREISLALGSP